MSFITVAIVNIEQNQQKMTIHELLHHNAPQFELLTDSPSQGIQSEERRRLARCGLSFVENAIARIRRLKPQILLMNTSRAMHECCDLLLALRDQCPGVRTLLVIDEAIEEDDLVQALACGARGFITVDLDSVDLTKAVSAINRGEAWVPRRMTATLMQRIVSASL